MLRGRGFSLQASNVSRASPSNFAAPEAGEAALRTKLPHTAQPAASGMQPSNFLRAEAGESRFADEISTYHSPSFGDAAVKTSSAPKPEKAALRTKLTHTAQPATSGTQPSNSLNAKAGESRFAAYYAGRAWR